MCARDHGACLCMYGDMHTSVGSSMHMCLTPCNMAGVCIRDNESVVYMFKVYLCVQRVEQRKSTRPWLALSWYRCQFIGDRYQTIAGRSMVGHRSSRVKAAEHSTRGTVYWHCGSYYCKHWHGCTRLVCVVTWRMRMCCVCVLEVQWAYVCWLRISQCACVCWLQISRCASVLLSCVWCACVCWCLCGYLKFTMRMCVLVSEQLPEVHDACVC